MKKINISMIAAMAACATFAAADDILVTFSTPGPDTYADGSTVMDGEFYALCWSTNFPDFKINTDGTAEGGKVVLAAPIAKDGRCPTIVYEVDAKLAASDYVGGEWAVYMLDTRDFEWDNVNSNLVARLSGGTSKVNTSGQVGPAVAGPAGSVANLYGVTAQSSEVAADEETIKPEITSIRIVDGNVWVKAKNVAPYLAWGLAGGDTPDKVETPKGEPQSGTNVDKKDDKEYEITFVTSVKEGGEFFKVERR